MFASITSYDDKLTLTIGAATLFAVALVLRHQMIIRFRVP